jgi:hypothetical protein
VFDRQVLESDRDYNRSVYENDRNYDRSVYESDRDYGWGREQYYGNLGRQQAADQMDYDLAMAKLANGGSSSSSSKSSSKSGTVASVPYTKIGYKNLGEMTDKLPMKLMSGSKTPDEYLDKLYDQLETWYEDGYIDESQVEALWNKFQPTDEMIEALKKAYPKSNGVASGSTKRYTTPGIGKRKDTVK